MNKIDEILAKTNDTKKLIEEISIGDCFMSILSYEEHELFEILKKSEYDLTGKDSITNETLEFLKQNYGI